MANGLFNLPGYLQEKDTEEALLGYASNPRQSPVISQVADLVEEDTFEAQLKNLKKLPSVIPKLNDETRGVYDKYNKFLKFYGATNKGDYGPHASFQSGLSSSLDMGMIQDLLEDQRAQQLSSQFHSIRDYVKDRPTMSRVAGAMDATLAEHDDLMKAFEKGRPDVTYQKNKAELVQRVNELGANAGIKYVLNEVAKIGDERGSPLSKTEIIEVATDWVANQEGVDTKAFLGLLNQSIEMRGGVARGGGMLTFQHRTKTTSPAHKKQIVAALKRAGISVSRFDDAGEDILINPRSSHEVDMNDADTRLALQDLRNLGVGWAQLPTQRGDRMRLTEGGQPLEGVYYSNNQFAVDQANKWVAENPANRSAVIDQTESEWEKGRYAVPPAERALYERQMIGARRVAATAQRGLEAIDQGAGGFAGKALFSIEHMYQLAGDLGIVSSALQGDHKTFATALIDQTSKDLMEVRAQVAADIEEGNTGMSRDDQKALTSLLDKWADKAAALGRDANRLQAGKQYQAQVLLGFLEAGLRAQVARMYISKDRMLASFYNEMKKNINLTGWGQSRQGAITTLKAIASESERRVEDLVPYVTEAPKPPYQVDPQSGSIDQYADPNAAANAVRARWGLPPL